jgi:uncharacterized protein YndB with AHSA1/START domain
MNEYGSRRHRRGAFRRLLRAERVWQYLTDSQLRGTWLATGTMEPRTDGR